MRILKIVYVITKVLSITLSDPDILKLLSILKSAKVLQIQTIASTTYQLFLVAKRTTFYIDYMSTYTHKTSSLRTKH